MSVAAGICAVAAGICTVAAGICTVAAGMHRIITLACRHPMGGNARRSFDWRPSALVSAPGIHCIGSPPSTRP